MVVQDLAPAAARRDDAMQLEARPPPCPGWRHVRGGVTWRSGTRVPGFGPFRERRKEEAGQGAARREGRGVQFSCRVIG